MGKEELELRIKYVETLLEQYITASDRPSVDKQRYEATIEKIRVK